MSEIKLNKKVIDLIGEYGHVKYQHKSDIVTLDVWQDLINAIKDWHADALAAKDARISELEGLLREWASMFEAGIASGPLMRLRNRTTESIASQQQTEPLIDTSAWQSCNPGCDPEFNGEKGRHCVCDPAKAAMSAKKANSINPEMVDVVGYTTAGMLRISKDLPLTGRIGAKCKPDERWNVPLMTVAQHSRIVAAKDAEIARLRELHENAHSAAKTLMAEKATLMEQAAHWLEVNAPSGGCIETNIADELRAEAEQLRAKPARQVGGDERDEFRAWFLGRYEYFDNVPSIAQARAEAAWMARAALAPAAVAAAAVVMPDRLPRSSDIQAIVQHNAGWNTALDEVARLNRRAIPVELLEIVRDTLEYWINRVDTRRMSKSDYNSWLALGHHSKAMTELRAMLGKDSEN